MALVYTEAGKNLLLGALPDPIYVQLHTGDPGSAGTSNVSSETTRKAVDLAAASGGARTSEAVAEWDPISLSGTENLTHVSYWSASSAGTCYAYGTVTTSRTGVVNGDTIRIPVGDSDWTIT